MEGYKSCNKCSSDKPFSKFYRNKSRPDGYAGFCKSCMNNYDTTKAGRERSRKTSKAYFQRNISKNCAKANRYRARKIQACPKWLSELHLKQIDDFYNNSSPGFHVDHIVPLKGKSVCGLHVPWNLQIIKAKDNLRKGNKVYIE